MNIDLLFTAQGEAGLISNENAVKKISGAILDTQFGTLSLEYVDMDFLELNIPVESEYFATMDMCAQLHIGAVKDGNIAQAYQVPLMLQDDPYRSELMRNRPVPGNALEAFGYFVKSAVFGQPVHREDLGDEDAMGCLLGDASPSSLQFAPHLARRHAMETAPKAAPGMNAPGMGLGGAAGGSGVGGGAASGGRTTRSHPPKKSTDD